MTLALGDTVKSWFYYRRNEAAQDETVFFTNRCVEKIYISLVLITNG
jgi:hypothetical protein